MIIFLVNQRGDHFLRPPSPITYQPCLRNMSVKSITADMTKAIINHFLTSPEEPSASQGMFLFIELVIKLMA